MRRRDRSPAGRQKPAAEAKGLDRVMKALEALEGRLEAIEKRLGARDRDPAARERGPGRGRPLRRR